MKPKNMIKETRRLNLENFLLIETLKKHNLFIKKKKNALKNKEVHDDKCIRAKTIEYVK